MSQVQEHSPAKSLKTFPEGIDIAPPTLLQSVDIRESMCAFGTAKSLITKLLSSLFSVQMNLSRY